ncbi:hypothetical protein OG607_19740 [Streptomyces sp. NBC_01537]|uniref:hypothetical protein n=1 Tax=Streptomyces sp. NBC_01537 TaxID=2903896 RepID=UPI0038692F8C
MTRFDDDRMREIQAMYSSEEDPVLRAEILAMNGISLEELCSWIAGQTRARAERNAPDSEVVVVIRIPRSRGLRIVERRGPKTGPPRGPRSAPGLRRDRRTVRYVVVLKFDD